MISNQERPCPICFELPPDSPQTWRARYTEVHNHSWDNRGVCDTHGICKECLARHIKVQVHEGRWNIRCPGEGCGYHLLYQDVERALEETDVAVLRRLECIRSQSCQGRLQEIVHAMDDDEARSWLLGECQPCPECFVVARRESGCDHVVCRCGCHFCARCGAPTRGLDPYCLCPWLESQARDGNVFFAAWLRASWASPCEWLWEAESAADEQARFIATLGFWLWRAGATIDLPMDWSGVAGAVNGDEQDAKPPLAPLKWSRDITALERRYGYEWGMLHEVELMDDPEWQRIEEMHDKQDFLQFGSVCSDQCQFGSVGHLRKEIYSFDSRRVLRRRARRPAPALRSGGAEGGLTPAKRNPKIHVPRKEKKVKPWKDQVVATGAF